MTTTAERAAAPLLIRRLRAEEVESVGRLARDAYAADYRLAPEYLDEIEAVGDRDGEHEVWVAENVVTGELLGTVTTPREGVRLSGVAVHDDELDFRFLGVAGSARGRGVGEAMVRHVLALAAERGLRRVVLNTGTQMRGAQRLYERMGFERIPERDFAFDRSDGVRIVILAYGIDVAPATARAGIAAG
ncbi:GNAT family N-acetyltransferase [Agromyces sp. LHK192]|uniref:GNAT family N-acetyltransferase n=1 Tax=Agromyces sp. LHK192 TaxID=2498704 RepID=UPI0013E3C513|nr:GNAT family N-acetyltransferase [Agromyces sp. LHK192]